MCSSSKIYINKKNVLLKVVVKSGKHFFSVECSALCKNFFM